MQQVYEVSYVGNDSHTHVTRVWAESRSEASRKVRKQGADEILHVRLKTHPLFGVAAVAAVIACIVLCAFLGRLISR